MNDYFEPSTMVSHLEFAPMLLGFAKSAAQAFVQPMLTKNYGLVSVSFEYDRQQALTEIESFLDFESDWDGYGAPSFKAKTISNARDAIGSLLNVARLPDITPNSNATISFEWESKLGFSHLEIGETKYSFFISMKSGDRYFSDGDADSINSSIGLMIEAILFPVYVPTSTMSHHLTIQAA